MPSKVFATVQTTDRLVNQIQNNISAAVNPLLSNPFLTGKILTKVSLASGSNTVNHGLGQPLVGWTIVRQRAGASIYDTQDSNSNPSTTLLLTSSAAVVVDLWVF